MSTSILISGASSIIGKPLVARLRDQGEKVIEVSRAIHDDEYHCCWDLSTQQLVETTLNNKKGQIHSLVHCAPIWLLPNHLPSLIEHGIKRIIVFSSTSIEGKSKSTSVHEQHIVELLKDAELEIWQATQIHDINATIFRPTMIYGYGQGFNLAFIAKIIQRFGIFPMVIGAKGLRQPVHADDLTNAVCLALLNEKSHGKTYVLSGSKVMTYESMVKQVFSVLGKKTKILKLPLSMFRGIITLANKVMNMPVDAAMADRMQENLDFDYRLAQQDFAYSPGPFLPNGIKDILPELKDDNDI